MSDARPRDTRPAAASLPAAEGPLHRRFDLALLDLDGVVYIGPDAVPGAAEALDRVRTGGTPLRFVTNNASRAPETVAEHLTSLGVPASVSEVVTSAQVAAALLARRFPGGSGVLVIGGSGLRDALAAEGLTPVESMDANPVAVVQGFGPDVGWRQLAEATRAVRAGLYWMATNLDLTVPTPHGRAPGNGALVQTVASAAGRPPDEVAGKPEPGAFREAALAAGSVRPLVVGDRLDTDLEGAQAAGMPGLLVLTGVTGASELISAPPRLRPTYVGRDLGSLLDPHPLAASRRIGSGSGSGAGPDTGPGSGAGVVAEGRCRAAVVRAEAVRDRIDVDVIVPGDDALDLLRAATVAVWSVRDPGTPQPVEDMKLIPALQAVEPGASWAR